MSQGKEIPCPKKRKSKSIKGAKSTVKELEEEEEEKWKSPPEDKKIGIRSAMRARSLSLGKEITHNVITDPSDIDVHTDDVINVRDDIASTHYARYSIPPRTFLVDRKFLRDLDFEEQIFVEQFADNNISGVVLTFDDDKPLYFSMFSQLLKNAPLSSVTMDACLADIRCRFGRSSVYVGSHTDGKQIFHETFSEHMAVNKVEVLQYTKLLIPIHKVEHWSLAVIDLPNRLFTVLDPVGTDEQDELDLCAAFQLYIRQLLGTLQERNPPAIIFNVASRTPIFQVQQNDFDCGLLFCISLKFSCVLEN